MIRARLFCRAASGRRAEIASSTFSEEYLEQAARGTFVILALDAPLLGTFGRYELELTRAPEPDVESTAEDVLPELPA